MPKCEVFMPKGAVNEMIEGEFLGLINIDGAVSAVVRLNEGGLYLEIMHPSRVRLIDPRPAIPNRL
jgi:hypothetical protein